MLRRRHRKRRTYDGTPIPDTTPRPSIEPTFTLTQIEHAARVALPQWFREAGYSSPTTSYEVGAEALVDLLRASAEAALLED